MGLPTNKIHKLFLSFTIATTVIGCMPIRNTVITPTKTLVILSVTPSITIEPSLTPMLAPTEELQLTPTVIVNQGCITIEDEIPPNLNLTGVWVRNEAQPYLEGLENQTRYAIPLKGGHILAKRHGDMAISPDGRSLAYIDSYVDSSKYRVEKRILRIVKSSGYLLPLGFWKEDRQWIIGWVDNQNLALFTANKDIIILNPFTGEQNKFQPPDWLNDINYNYYFPFYSPKLDKILVGSDAENFGFKDVQTGKTIFQGTAYLGEDDFDWSVDGTGLAVRSDDGYSLNIFLNDQKTAEFDVRKMPDNSASISNMKLSPNSHKLVFTTYDKNFLLDVGQLKINALCTQRLLPSMWMQPSWSPDSRYVIQEFYDQNNYSRYVDVIIDTQEMSAFKLPTSKYYKDHIGWLASP